MKRMLTLYYYFLWNNITFGHIKMSVFFTVESKLKGSLYKYYIIFLHLLVKDSMTHYTYYNDEYYDILKTLKY